MRLGWAVTTDHFFSCPERNAARVPRAGAHFTLHGVVFAILCPGPAVHRPLRVEDARERAYEAPRHVRDTRSLALRAYGESIQLQPITLYRDLTAREAEIQLRQPARQVLDPRHQHRVATSKN